VPPGRPLFAGLAGGNRAGGCFSGLAGRRIPRLCRSGEVRPNPKCRRARRCAPGERGAGVWKAGRGGRGSSGLRLADESAKSDGACRRIFRRRSHPLRTRAGSIRPTYNSSVLFFCSEIPRQQAFLCRGTSIPMERGWPPQKPTRSGGLRAAAWMKVGTGSRPPPPGSFIDFGYAEAYSSRPLEGTICLEGK